MLRELLQALQDARIKTKASPQVSLEIVTTSGLAFARITVIDGDTELGSVFFQLKLKEGGAVGKGKTSYPTDLAGLITVKENGTHRKLVDGRYTCPWVQFVAWIHRDNRCYRNDLMLSLPLGRDSIKFIYSPEAESEWRSVDRLNADGATSKTGIELAV